MKKRFALLAGIGAVMVVAVNSKGLDAVKIDGLKDMSVNEWKKLDELKKHTILVYEPTARMFAQVGGHGLKNVSLQWDYLPKENRVFVYSGGEMKAYSAKTEKWERIDAEPHEGGSKGASLCYDPINHELLQVGGQKEPAGVYLYDIEKMKWRELNTGSAALNALQKEAIQIYRNAIAFEERCAGQIKNAETGKKEQRDLASLAAAFGKQMDIMKQKALAGQVDRLEIPATKHAAGLLVSLMRDYGELARKLRGGVTLELLGKVREARMNAGKVKAALSPEPSSRVMSRAAYDPVHRKIILFGGEAEDRVLSDTWVYDCATRKWQQRFPGKVPPPRAGHILCWLPGTKKMVLAGGYSRVPLGQDIWTYDVAMNQWALLQYVPVPDQQGRKDFLDVPRANQNGKSLIGVCGPDKTLVVLSPESKWLWACRIDPSKVMKKKTDKIGVEPLSFTFSQSRDSGMEE